MISNFNQVLKIKIGSFLKYKIFFEVSKDYEKDVFLKIENAGPNMAGK